MFDRKLYFSLALIITENIWDKVHNSTKYQHVGAVYSASVVQI